MLFSCNKMTKPEMLFKEQWKQDIVVVSGSLYPASRNGLHYLVITLIQVIVPVIVMTSWAVALAESSGDEGDGGRGGFLSHPYGMLSISSSASVSGMSDGGQGSCSPTSAAPGVKLPRTLSTSVLRIKHRTSFWDKFWQDRSRRD